jgi:hypothetical protein
MTIFWHFPLFQFSLTDILNTFCVFGSEIINRLCLGYGDGDMVRRAGEATDSFI